jgi:hypothetical protein
MSKWQTVSAIKETLFAYYDTGLINMDLLELGCLCPVVVHNDYVVLDRHTHNTFTGTTILL